MNTSNEVFDLAIIGGGIAGAAIARDAALRGLSVILFEKNTFGSGTSSKSSKLIHGGLRYLELAWFAFKKGEFKEAWKNVCFVLSSLRESVILERIAPDLVKPMPLLVPIYKNEGQHIFAVSLGSFFYGLLGIVLGNPRFPKLLWSKQSVLKVLPNLNPKDLVGGIIIWDHVTNDQSLVEETMRSAARHGAKTFEHTFVKTYTYNAEDQVYALAVEGDGKTELFQARRVVNASGPWVDKVRSQADEKKGNLIVPVAGSHITLQKFVNHSVILRAQDKRVFFVINVGDVSRVGTTERIYSDPDTLEPLEEEIEYLLGALERYFPAQKFAAEDILSKDAGIRPLAKPKGKVDPHGISREHEIHIGPTGVMHILGVKLTDHRRAAEDIMNRISREIKREKPSVKLKTSTHQIPLKN